MELAVNHIYNTDYIDLMRIIPDGHIDLILTDPPYGIQYQNSYTYKKSPVLKEMTELITMNSRDNPTEF